MKWTVPVLAILTLASGELRAEDQIVANDVIAAGLKKAECEMPLEEAADNLGLQALTAGLKLVEVPCTNGAYNFDSILFAIDLRAAGKARLLQFQTWDGAGFKPAFALASPTFEPKRLRLTSHHKGRGVGDCGSFGEWKWSGNDFKMTGYWNKDNCDGQEFGPETNLAKYRVFPKR